MTWLLQSEAGKTKEVGRVTELELPDIKED
jgi:hypothetical protein